MAEEEWGESLDGEIAVGQQRASGAERWTEPRWAGRKRKCGRQERNLKSYCSGGERERQTDGQDTDRAATGAARHGCDCSHGRGRSTLTTSALSYRCRARGQRSGAPLMDSAASHRSSSKNTDGYFWHKLHFWFYVYSIWFGRIYQCFKAFFNSTTQFLHWKNIKIKIHFKIL